MATQNGVMNYIDESGNVTELYPKTKSELVDGVLTLEEIQASTDLSGKIASASALKNVNNRLNNLYAHDVNSGKYDNLKISNFGTDTFNFFYFGSFNKITGFIIGHIYINYSGSVSENDVYDFRNGSITKTSATLSSDGKYITIPLLSSWTIGNFIANKKVTIEYE